MNERPIHIVQRRRSRHVALLLLVSAGSALAEVHYVDANSTKATTPFTTWATAATNIQDAVDAAMAGDEVVVTNGIYATGGRAVYGTMTNRVAVDKPLALRSANGPQVTIIEGRQVPNAIVGDGAIRCVYLTNGASLLGFTLYNGATRTADGYPTNHQSSGGGLWCESTNGVVVSNCVVESNWALNYGGGVYGGTLNNCTLNQNSALFGGGAAYAVLENSTLTRNGSVDGIGVAYSKGGGGAFGCTLNNCSVTGNGVSDVSYPWYAYGGGAAGCTLNNCLLVGNLAFADSSGFAYGGGAEACILHNCTLVGNSIETVDARGFDGAGAASCTLENCIAYGNQGTNYDRASTLNYCCTIPQPASGVGNITNPPVFLDVNSGNLRLQSNSPCINAGNNSYVTNTTDLDGNPRITGGTVDIGAYEFQPPAPQLTIAVSGTNVVLRWPVSYAGFVYSGYIVQETFNLLSSNGWAVADLFPPIIVNGQFQVTRPMLAPQISYRLSR